jgi:hypothetical protein
MVHLWFEVMTTLRISLSHLVKDCKVGAGFYLGNSYHIWLECCVFTREHHQQRSYPQMVLDSWLKTIAPIHSQEGELSPYCLYLFHLVYSCKKQFRTKLVILLQVTDILKRTWSGHYNVKTSTARAIYPPLFEPGDQEIGERVHKQNCEYFDDSECYHHLPAYLLCCNICNSHSQSASTMVILDLIAISTYSMSPSPSCRMFCQYDKGTENHQIFKCQQAQGMFSYLLNPSGMIVGAFARYIPFTMVLPAPLTRSFMLAAVDKQKTSNATVLNIDCVFRHYSTAEEKRSRD